MKVNNIDLKVDFIVSFENGIELKSTNECIDFYSRIIFTQHTKCYLFSSCDNDMVKFIHNISKSNNIDLCNLAIENLNDSSIIIPGTLYNKCLMKINENSKLTIADIIHDEYGYDRDFWHEYFDQNDRSRYDLLSL